MRTRLLQSGTLRCAAHAALAAAALLVAALPLAAQQQAPPPPSLDLKSMRLFDKPQDIWPTYNGDYSGQRFATLTEVNQKTINRLKTKWAYKIEGVTIRGSGNPTIKSTPLMVDGVLYFTVPDHVFAVDARTGKERWRFDFEDH
ncbi:MAG TPA: hypothetical protein VIM60_11385, partial [Edaphobacter sp.]